jgi:hypothetical protein
MPHSQTPQGRTGDYADRPKSLCTGVKSVILIYLVGGPPHQDMFDYKESRKRSDRKFHLRRCHVLQSHRREFLQEVSGGMLAVLVGSELAVELGLAAEDNKDDKTKTPADLARLSQLIQQTPTKSLLATLHGS